MDNDDFVGSALLEMLLLRILSPDNVLRAAAEKELERRSSTVPDFCVALAHYCARVVGDDTQNALALVALSVLKRGLSMSTQHQELRDVVSLFLSHLGDVAVMRAVTVAVLRQWNSVVVTGVRRLAVLRVPAASQAKDITAVAASFELVSDLIMSKLLKAFAHLTQADTAGMRIMYSHVNLLQTLLEEPVLDVTHAWCADLVATCVSPLLEILCTATTANPAVEAASSLDACRMRCTLQAHIAETLCVLYEWQFTAAHRSKFPTDLRQVFLQALPSLLTYTLIPCIQWASVDTQSTSVNNPTIVLAALSRASPLIAASLATQEFVVKVLQCGGWYKRCASPELLQQLLSSLEADAASYQVALNMGDSDDMDVGPATAGPSGTHADSWATFGNEVSCDRMLAESVVLVRRHVTQRWTLFRDVAFLPFLQRGLIDIVGDQCGRRYYELLLSYALLASSEVDAWLDDPNVFLREEDERDDGVRWTTRDVVAQLYTDSITALGPLFLHASLEDLHKRLFSEVEEAATATNGIAGHSGQLLFIQRESSLFFMEVVLYRCSKNLRECGTVDFSPLAAHIWRYDIAGPTAHAATSARALMLLSAIVKFSCAPSRSRTETANFLSTPAALNDFMATAVAESAAVLTGFVTPSSTASCSLLVTVVLCRFLQSTLVYWPPTVLERHFASLQNSLLALLSPQAGLTEEVLYDTVEQLTDFLHAAQRAMRKNNSSSVEQAFFVSERLPAIVMDCWRRHVNDPSLADVVLQLLRRVVRDSGPNGCSVFTQLLQELSWVNNVLCGYADSVAEVCAVPYFLRLLRCIFVHAPDDVANGTATLMLDNLCQLLLCTNESAIMVASSSCLAALLRRYPAAQSVPVHVSAASMLAALRHTGSADEESTEVNIALVARAQRDVYSFSSVIVAIVLRTLQDAHNEASLLEMGQALVTIMRQSASFSETDLLRVIHATVHRLGVVRTDTVVQQLLAPLATLLLLHPVALLRTLVQGGLLAETMAHWLPRVEHFTTLSVTYSSCEGLLGLLQLLSEPAHASMTAEQGQKVAQQPVFCRWKLPENVSGSAASSNADTRKAAKCSVGKKGGKSLTQQLALASTFGGDAVVETSLPLYAAILVGVGRGLLRLLGAPLSALRRASQPDSTDLAEDGETSCFSDEDDVKRDRRLFHENSSDDNGENSEESWAEEEDKFEDDNDDSDVAVASTTAEQDAARSLSDGIATSETKEKERLMAAMGAQLLPWMQKYGSEISPYFSFEETQLLMLFFASTGNNSTV